MLIYQSISIIVIIKERKKACLLSKDKGRLSKKPEVKQSVLTDICVFWSCSSGGSRCLVLITVSLGLICVLLLIFIILLYFTITAERDLIKTYKNTAEEFNQTINSLQDNYTDLMTEKHQLQNNFSSLITTLSDELKKNSFRYLLSVFLLGNQCSLDGLFVSKKSMSWSASRQYCRDRGGDLVIIKSLEKLMSSLVRLSERAWIGLSDIANEGNLTWVDKSPLNQGFWFEGEPNDEDGNEDCVEMMAFSSTLNNWNDLSCSARRRGICEK
uniref:CD209 antigen-like n=1 Tax=Sinocyclocheilus rhinocerous TaxID=307959 RepID=A0A673GHX1_9TELE